jgi:hypothetical protein
MRDGWQNVSGEIDEGRRTLMQRIDWTMIYDICDTIYDMIRHDICDI